MTSRQSLKKSFRNCVKNEESILKLCSMIMVLSFAKMPVCHPNVLSSCRLKKDLIAIWDTGKERFPVGSIDLCKVDAKWMFSNCMKLLVKNGKDSLRNLMLLKNLRRNILKKPFRVIKNESLN